MELTVQDFALVDAEPAAKAQWSSPLFESFDFDGNVSLPQATVRELDFAVVPPAHLPGYADLWKIDESGEDLATAHMLYAPDNQVTVSYDPSMAARFQDNNYVSGLGRQLVGTPDVMYRKGRFFGSDLVVAFEPEPDQPATERPIDLPIMRLHCPKNAGCTATESFNVARTDKVEGKIAIVGLNASGTASATVTLGQTWETADGDCLQYLVPATLRLEIGRTLVNGEAVAFGMRATVVDIGKGVAKQCAIAPADDYCQKPESEIRPECRLWSQPLAIRDGSGEWSAKVGSEQTGQVGVDLEFFGQKLTVGMAYSRTYSAELERSYKLAKSDTSAYLPYTRIPSNNAAAVDDIYWTTQ
jgi:hypothetical protein